MKNFKEIANFFKSSRINNVVFFSFLICAFILSLLTYRMFLDVDLYRTHSRIVITVLYFDAAVVLILLSLGINKLMRLLSGKHKHSSRLTLKLVTIFSILAIVPSVVMCIFSAVFFHNGLDSWFNERNQSVLHNAINIANSCLNEQKNRAISDCSFIAKAISSHVNKLDHDQESFDQTLNNINNSLDDLCKLRGIKSAIIMDKNLMIFAHSKYSVSLFFLNFYYRDIDALKNITNRTNIISMDDEGIFVASTFRGFNGDNFLIIEKAVDASILTYNKNANNAYQDYYEFQQNRWSLEIMFILLFFSLGCLLLLGAIALAIEYSLKIVKPVSYLIDVSEEIINGNLNARATKNYSYGEINILAQTFNNMLDTVQNQQKALVQANCQLDERVKFSNNVLSSISSGIIGIENEKIYIWNAAAEKLLSTKISLDDKLKDIFPEAWNLVQKNESEYIQQNVQYVRGKDAFVFDLKITNFTISGTRRIIITINDLTDMIISQRKEAWTEVARRVAHEIKNPLTPIQLSAERLQRKYMPQILKDSDIFKNLTNVIIKQVGDIKRLLDEFNFFARLPEPVIKKCDLREICKQAIELMENISDGISIKFNAINTPITIMADERLIHQSIMNLLQNAICALSTVQKNEKIINITFATDVNWIHLYIEDNGPGFPKEKIESLATPYFTLMPKGTGLGLAIVKKIIQDHQGTIMFGESDYGGAKVTISFPQKEII